MKKTFLYTLLGSLAIFLVFWGVLNLKVNPFGYAFCFIVPIAGLLIGTIIGGTISSGAKKDNLLDVKKLKLASALICVGLIALLTLFQYGSTFVEEVNGHFRVNNAFRGEHISNYLIGDEEVNFPVFFRLNFVEPTYEVNSRYGTQGYDTGIPGIGVIIYLLQYVVAVFFSRIYIKELGNLPVCDTCKAYYVTKHLDRFSTENANESIDKVLSCVETGTGYVPVSPKLKKFNLAADACYCPKCSRGYIRFITPVRNGKQIQQVEVARRELENGQMLFYLR